MQALIDELKQTQQQLIDVVSSIPGDKIDTVPFEGSWTAGEVLEHLIKSVGTATLRGNTITVSRPADEKIATLRSSFHDFTKKFTAPSFVVPSEAKHDKEEQLSVLVAKFDRLIEAVGAFDLTQECTDFAIPGFGNFTRLEWIAFHMIHTQRHLEQLKNIAAKLKEV